MPDLVTYVGSLDRLQLAHAHKATQIILDDPSLSCRSYQVPDAEALATLKTLLPVAVNYYPESAISVNYDAVMYDATDYTDLVLAVLKHYPGIKLRVYDYGIMMAILQKDPGRPVCFSADIGQMNTAMVTALPTPYCLLSPELTYHQIKQLPNLSYDLLVHGPVLLQYSYRQYLGKSGPGYIDDAAYPGRLYPVLENNHGHFMYFYMDRCLLSVATALKTLTLNGWIVDGRGQSDAYLRTALAAYQAVLTGSAVDEAAVQAVSPRPLKPLFFIANRTDSNTRVYPDDTQCVGSIIHSEKQGKIYAELCDWVTTGDALGLYTPQSYKRQETQYYKPAPDLRDITGKRVHQAGPGEIIQLPWIRGAAVGSRLLVFQKFDIID